ncbi:molybdenum cofactor guanylyltransferase MobA [Sneathiella sp. CAU 1612]|uniref:Molybdenum cofactor guanylyltransferase n=1 Tax=Sneathiella sedimenti TaxID=2816034 RepID=A0ABS3F9N3_9PROT|nr:molybdenum cofactor guanylyltransferase MobA [Sneathiella sedimenti]MBO0335236.1 molybdenum cofactor guanylyltransferase MobA [Sneathiella sedimenti]
MTNDAQLFPCVLLAGGQSRRMGGGTKFLQKLGGKSLLTHIIDTLRPQVSEFVLNMNVKIADVASPEIPIIQDSVTGFAGPLAGILTGMEYFQRKGSKATHMLSVPTDSPFIPGDLVERLAIEIQGNTEKIVMAHSGGRVHPVVALWPLSLGAYLRAALVEEDLRKILIFANRYPRSEVIWDEVAGDPFFNINRPEDLEEAERRLLQSSA